MTRFSKSIVVYALLSGDFFLHSFCHQCATPANPESMLVRGEMCRARSSAKTLTMGVSEGAWRLPLSAIERRTFVHGFGAGGDGNLQALLVGAKGRRNALWSMGAGRANLLRVVQRQGADHGGSRGSTEAPLTR